MFASLKRSCVLCTGLSVVQDDGILKVFRRTLHCSKVQRLEHIQFPSFLSLLSCVIGDIPLMWTKNNLCLNLKIPTTVFPNYQFTLWISHRKKVLPPKGLRRKHGYATQGKNLSRPRLTGNCKNIKSFFLIRRAIIKQLKCTFFSLS